MELVSVRIEESPLALGRVRLVGDVAYDDRPGTEAYWFEVDEEHAGALSLSGSPWLACLLPLAVTLGQKLRLGAPVDPLLFENAPRLMETWTTWYRKRFPHLRVVAIEAELEKAPRVRVAPLKTGAFFSGGIDSFYTILRNAELEDRSAFPRIDSLLWVGGFDLPLGSPEEEFGRLRSRLSAAAQELGMGFLDVRTNLRTTRFRAASWGHVAHGCALASVGLALEGLFQTIYIGATHESGEGKPWGSQPDTDPLLSTRSTRFVHDGAMRRSDKTEHISRSEVAMRTLHVCFRSGSAENCCDCRKCLLAMMTLELLGAMPRCSAFPRPLDLQRVRRVYLRGPTYWRHYGDVLVRARKSGRSDIARAIVACRWRYCFMKPAMTAIEWLGKRKGLRRVARVLRPALLKGTVR
jgi:hypothetical protein